MKRFNGFEKGTVTFYNSEINDKATSDCWPTNKIQLIKMKNGNFTLGLNLYYRCNNDAYYNTRQIYLDENNIPYILITTEPDFTPENCENEITNKNFPNMGHQSHENIIEKNNILTLGRNDIVKERSIFRFTNNSINKDYFSEYSKTSECARLNQRGLAIVLKFVEDPKNREILDKRIKMPTSEDFEILDNEMKFYLEQFLSGEISENEMISLINFYTQAKNGNGLMGNEIVCDLPELEQILLPTQSQKE